MADPSKVVFKYPAIPEPTQDVASLQAAVKALKATVEKLTGQTRGTESIDQRVLDLKSSTVANGRATEARLTEIDEVHTDAESALAQRTTTVEAQAGGISAGGDLVFLAKAGPDGYTAQYSLALKAGLAEAGFSILARQEPDMSYTSSIVLTANQFRLQDPLLGPTPVFNYADGIFQFNVPVRLLGEQIEERGVTNSNFVITGNTGASVSIMVRAGSQVQIFSEAQGNPGRSYPFPIGTNNLKLYRRLEGEDEDQNVLLREKPMSYFIFRADNNLIFYLDTTMMFRDTPPTAGTYIYSIENAFGLDPFALLVTELFR